MLGVVVGHSSGVGVGVREGLEGVNDPESDLGQELSLPVRAHLWLSNVSFMYNALCPATPTVFEIGMPI